MVQPGFIPDDVVLSVIKCMTAYARHPFLQHDPVHETHEIVLPGGRRRGGVARSGMSIVHHCSRPADRQCPVGGDFPRQSVRTDPAIQNL